MATENNQISTLVIPQTFFTHLSKDINKGDKGKGSEKKSISRSSSASSSISVASKADSRSDARRGRGGRGGGARSGRGGREKDEKEEKEDQSDSSSAAPAAPVGLPSLSELYLSGNKITTLKGFDAYGTVGSEPFSPLLNSQLAVLRCLGSHTQLSSRFDGISRRLSLRPDFLD
jgi:Leucine-rich repeat (LRR) protein